MTSPLLSYSILNKGTKLKKLSYLCLHIFISTVSYAYVGDDFNQLFRTAYDYYQANQYEEAISYWQECLRLKPGNNDLLYNIGYLYNEIGEFDKAQKIFEQLFVINPSDERLRGKLWIAYLRNQDWQNGVKVIDAHDHWWYDKDIREKWFWYITVKDMV